MFRMHYKYSMLLLACSLVLLSSTSYADDGGLTLSPLYSNEIKQPNDPSMATPNPTPTLSQPTQSSEPELAAMPPNSTSLNNTVIPNSSLPTPNPAVAMTPPTAAIAPGSESTPNSKKVDSMFNNDSSSPTPNPALAPPPIPGSNFPGTQPLTPNVSLSHFGLPSNTPQFNVGFNDSSRPTPNSGLIPPPAPALPYYERPTPTTTTTTTSSNGSGSTTTTTTSGNNSSGGSGNGSGSGGGSGTSNNSNTSTPGSTPATAIPSATPVGSNSNNSAGSNSTTTNGNNPNGNSPNGNSNQTNAMNYADALRSCTAGNYTTTSQTTTATTGNIGGFKTTPPPQVTYQIAGMVNGQCQVTIVQQAVTPPTVGTNGTVTNNISPAATMSKCNFNPNNLNALATQAQQSANNYGNAATNANSQSIMSSSCSSYLMVGNAAVPFQSAGNSSNNTVGNLVGKPPVP